MPIWERLYRIRMNQFIMFSSRMSRSSILIPLFVLVILIAVLALVLYCDIRHTYRDGDLWKKWQHDMPSSMTLALSVMTIYWDLPVQLQRNSFSERSWKYDTRKAHRSSHEDLVGEEYIKNSWTLPTGLFIWAKGITTMSHGFTESLEKPHEKQN